jgi:penicillin-binding protein 2
VSDRSRLRLIVMQVLVMSLLATLLGRLWFLQIHDGAKYQNLAAENTHQPVVTEATRGLILDDMGRLLVTNRTSLAVTVDPAVLRTMTADERTALFTRLAPMLKTTVSNLVDVTTACGTPGAKPYVAEAGAILANVPSEHGGLAKAVAELPAG